MTNSVSAARSRSASSWNSGTVRISPKCGTGTSWPSTGLWMRCAPAGARWVTNWWPCRFQSTQVVGAAALLQAEDFAVEVPGGGQVVDRHGQVEPRDRGVEDGHSAMLRTTAALAARETPHTNRARNSRLSTLP